MAGVFGQIQSRTRVASGYNVLRASVAFRPRFRARPLRAADRGRAPHAGVRPPGARLRKAADVKSYHVDVGDLRC